MNNHFVTERLGKERVVEAVHEAERARLARLAEAAVERTSLWIRIMGKVMPDAAGAREVPGL